MRRRDLVQSSLRHHLRSHVAVVLACATAAAIICGALLVGDSVKGSLRDRAMVRLGRVDHSIVAQRFFREDLATGINAAGSGGVAVPAILLRGMVVDRETGRRARDISVIGIDERFRAVAVDSARWGVEKRIGVVNELLATELQAAVDHSLLIRFERASDVARELALGDRRAESTTSSLEIRIGRIVPDDGVGSFDLRNQQQTSRNVFVALDRLQRQLDRQGQINAVLWCRVDEETPAMGPAPFLASAWKLEDVGAQLRADDERRYISVDSPEFILSKSIAAAARHAAHAISPPAPYLEVLTYLANTITVGGKEIPYSTVTALGEWTHADESVSPLFPESLLPENIELNSGGAVLTSWAIDDLEVGKVDSQPVRIDFYAVDENDERSETSHTFELRGSVPLTEEIADARWTPTYPGVSDADNLSDWDPPVEVDLTRFRNPGPDQDYWKAHRTAPKAFVSLEDGRRLWGTRFGSLTSLRVKPTGGRTASDTLPALRRALRDAIDPSTFGLAFRPSREEASEAAASGTDFAMLFVSMSFFIIVSALMLAAMSFRLALERRARELGLLGAVGFPGRSIARLLIAEGLVVAVIGSAVGLLGGVGYAALLIFGLRTLWIDAVNTPFLSLHVSGLSLSISFLATVLLSAWTVWRVVRGLTRVPPRWLLSGECRETADASRLQRRRAWDLWITLALAALSVGLLAAGTAGLVDATMAFFGIGASVLIGGLSCLSWRIRRPLRDARAGGLRARGVRAYIRLGARNGRRAPARSLLTAGLIAGATFIVVTVGASRTDPGNGVPKRDSGDGGFTLIATTSTPMYLSLATPDGREELELAARSSALLGQPGVKVYPTRQRPGDETSCLNLYRPKEPKILGLSSAFIARGGFRWAGTLAESEAERENPWLLLEKRPDDWPQDVIAAVGDFNTLQWILHLGLGDDLTVTNDRGRKIRLRIVGLIPQSIFQGGLAIAESSFLEHFPRHPGWSTFFIESPGDDRILTEGIRSSLEDDEALAGFGFDARTTGEMLADFNRVQNTYLSTFLVLGGLGVLLGVLGLGAVLLRNVIERRGELGLLRAVGYPERALAWIVVSETAALLVAGVGLGVCAALVSVVPNLLVSGTQISWGTIGGLVGLVVLAGLASSVFALRAAMRTPLLGALRAQ